MFKIICLKCNKQADEMAYKRIAKGELRVIYICPNCGYVEVNKRFLYE